MTEAVATTRAEPGARMRLGTGGAGLPPRDTHDKLAGRADGRASAVRFAGSAAALAIQFLMVLAFLDTGGARHDPTRPIELLMLPDDSKAKETPRLTKPPEIPALRPVVQITLPQPIIRVAEAPAHMAPPLEAPATPLAASAATTTAITLPSAPPPAAAGAVSDAFNAAVRAAVFAAYRVPASAREMGEFGDTRIVFTLVDGAVGNIRVVSTSGHALLDSAALAAVHAAQYPSTPEALHGKTLGFEIVLYSRRSGG